MDVRESSKSLSVTTSVAGLSLQNQQRQFSSFWNDTAKTSFGIKIARGADGTPWTLNFGELHEHLRECARYFVRKQVTLIDGTIEDRFTTVPYSEFVKLYPRFRNTSYGVLDVSAVWLDITVLSKSGISRRTIRKPPLIMQKGNSSCMQSMHWVRIAIDPW